MNWNIPIHSQRLDQSMFEFWIYKPLHRGFTLSGTSKKVIDFIYMSAGVRGKCLFFRKIKEKLGSISALVLCFISYLLYFCRFKVQTLREILIFGYFVTFFFFSRIHHCISHFYLNCPKSEILRLLMTNFLTKEKNLFLSVQRLLPFSFWKKFESI